MKFLGKIDYSALLMRALRGRGSVYDLLGNYRKAIEDYKTLQKYTKYRADAYFGISEVFEKMGKYKSALVYIQRALRNCSDNLKKMELLNQKIFLLMRLGDLSSIMRIERFLLALIDRSNKEESEKIRIILARSFYNRSVFYLQTGKYNLALKFAKMCLRVSASIKDKRSLALAFNLLGIINRRIGKFDLSLKYYQKSLKYFTEIGDIGQIAGVYINIGNLESNWQNALLYYKKAISIFTKIGYKIGIIEIANNIGNTYLARGMCKKAISEYMKGYNLSKKMSNKFGMALSLSGIGKAYKLLGNYTRAHKFFLKSLSLTSEIKDREGILENIYMIALLKYDMNDKSVLLWLKRAEHLAEELSDYNVLAEIMYRKLESLIQNKIKIPVQLLKRIESLGKVRLPVRARIFLLFSKIKIRSYKIHPSGIQQKKKMLKELERFFNQTTDREMSFYLGQALINFLLMDDIKKAFKIFKLINRLICKTEMRAYYSEILFLKAKLNYYKGKNWSNNIKKALCLAKRIGNYRVIKEINQWLESKDR